MKKLTLFISALLLSSIINAQVYTILSENNVDITGDTAWFEAGSNEDLSLAFSVKNNDAIAHDVKIKFEVEQLVEGSNYAFCWDQCYASPRSGFISGAVTIDANSTNSNGFQVDFSPLGNSGETLFKFSFFEDGSTDTSIVFIGFKISNITSINENTGKIKLYPNPANKFVIVENLTDETTNIVLKSMDGRTVKSKKYSGNKTIIDISDLKAGIYIVHIVSQNNINYSYKLLVK
ncbi:MAG: T9SS type A sorting domain-containing protein [Chlorobi bacterium]|nr:T9SS type A sorting domain-containing protein [Chlorobiota bacterium]